MRVDNFLKKKVPILLLILSILILTQVDYAQNTPLQFEQIRRAIREKKISQEQLADRINQRRVDFLLTEKDELQLRKWGATDVIIDAIKANQPIDNSDTANAPFTLVQIYKLLKTSKTPESVASLISQIKEKKVREPITKDEEAYFLSDGINAELIEAIRNNPFNLTMQTSQSITSKGFTNSIGMEFVVAPKGSYMMGSDNFTDAEKPVRRITFAKDFYIGKFEVTQSEWQKVMGDAEKRLTLAEIVDYSIGDEYPMVWVSWYDAQEFIKRLNEKNDGFRYSLPSEAEWEYACRAGTNTTFAFGDTISLENANFYNSRPADIITDTTPDIQINMLRRGTHYPANLWGLYNMHGNVWEWVEDIYSSDYKGLKTDGSANSVKGEPSLRIIRGGSWTATGKMDLRSSNRGSDSPDKKSRQIGFRIVAKPIK